MNVAEDVTVFPSRIHFVDTEPKFLEFKKGIRVLPAPYFKEYYQVFFLWKRYEPGEHKYFPKGGFEVLHENGGMYNYDLDQVIVHPFELRMNRYFTTQKGVDREKKKLVFGGKRGRPRKNPEDLQVKKVYVPTGGKRGRKPMSDEERAKRDLLKAPKNSSGTGKRGRPRKDPNQLQTSKIYVPTGGKRGRPKKIETI